MTEEQIIEKIIDRAMTSGAVIGPEFINDHSHAWETDRKIYSDEIMSLIKQAQYEYGLELIEELEESMEWEENEMGQEYGYVLGDNFNELRQRNEEKRT